MPSSCALLVSSTDSFADTWPPFFALLAEYWPQPDRVPIYLNSEHLTASHRGLDIRNTRTGRFFPGRHPTWSESIRAALSLIEHDYVMYVQDDYFLSGPVRVDVLDEAVDAMKVYSLAHVRLVDGSSVVKPGPGSMLETIRRSTKYYLSLQAGLWRREVFLDLLRRHESPWDFELLGSHRARLTPHRLTRVRFDEYHALRSRVFPYNPTGIVRGRWSRAIVEELFASHGIRVDFSARGFTHEDAARPHSTQRDRLRRALRAVRSMF